MTKVFFHLVLSFFNLPIYELTGWLYKLKLDTLSELDNLMDEEGYNKFLQQEGGKESGQQD